MRIAIIQRVIKNYRLPMYRVLLENNEVMFFYGDDVPGTKSKSCNVKEVNCVKCNTTHYFFIKRAITVQWDLVSKLRKYKPDFILVEGESHIVGCLQAVFYQQFFDRKVGIAKWCFIDLPGEERSGLRFALKYSLQRLFDAFVLYSSYSKRALKRYKVNLDRAFVAVNVSDVEALLQRYEAHFLEKSDARNVLDVLDCFTVLFIGNLEKQKRFERYLDVAELCKEQPIQFLVAGGGNNLEYYTNIASERGLENVKFLGHLSDPSKAYFASDVIYIPGRGGMVISEALCFARPVLVHYADGTESDLIDGKGTGYILEDNSEAVASQLVELEKAPERVEQMGRRGQVLVRDHYNTRNMAEQVLEAARFSIESRS